MTKRQPTMKTLAPPPPPAAEPSTARPKAQLSPLIERLRAWRKKNKLKQQETADRLEISYDTYKAYECGHRNPNGPNTQKILVLLGELKK